MITALKKLLSGRKTYAVGLGMIAAGLSSDPINIDQILEGIAFITVRQGIAKATNGQSSEPPIKPLP